MILFIQCSRECFSKNVSWSSQIRWARGLLQFRPWARWSWSRLCVLQYVQYSNNCNCPPRPRRMDICKWLWETWHLQWEGRFCNGYDWFIKHTKTDEVKWKPVPLPNQNNFKRLKNGPNEKGSWENLNWECPHTYSRIWYEESQGILLVLDSLYKTNYTTCSGGWVQPILREPFLLQASTAQNKNPFRSMPRWKFTFKWNVSIV